MVPCQVNIRRSLDDPTNKASLVPGNAFKYTGGSSTRLRPEEKSKSARAQRNTTPTKAPTVVPASTAFDTYKRIYFLCFVSRKLVSVYPTFSPPPPRLGDATATAMSAFPPVNRLIPPFSSGLFSLRYVRITSPAGVIT